MHVPHQLFKSFRATVAICLLIAGLMAWLAYTYTRPRDSYPHYTGKLVYYGNKLANLSYRDTDKYRFIILDGFEGAFEAFPQGQTKRVDSLRLGDTLTAWYIVYQDDEGNNRMLLKYLYKNGRAIYSDDSEVFLQIGIAVAGLLIFVCLYAYYDYRRGKIDW